MALEVLLGEAKIEVEVAVDVVGPGKGGQPVEEDEVDYKYSRKHNITYKYKEIFLMNYKMDLNCRIRLINL